VTPNIFPSTVWGMFQKTESPSVSTSLEEKELDKALIPVNPTASSFTIHMHTFMI
jgi:hypothetical protein